MKKYMMTAVVLVSLLSLLNCTNSSSHTDESKGVQTDAIPLVINSLHSQMHGDKQVYRIKSSDTVTFDFTDYDFQFNGEHYTFIREAIAESYKVTFPGSFSNADIYYNDSIRFPLTPVEIVDEKIYSFPTVMDSLKQRGLTRFDLVFTFYLDNGFGEDIIDRFAIEIVE